MEEDAYCPYCDKVVEICHDDGFGQTPDKDYKYQCPYCGAWFVFQVEYVINYTTEVLHE